MKNHAFYDQRINSACAKIYQRGILFATVIALCYGILHFVALSVQTQHLSFVSASAFQSFYIFFLPELTVLLSGCSILLFGHFLHSDPSTKEAMFSAQRFYMRGVKILVSLTFFAYALTIPLSGDNVLTKVPLNYLPLLFETLGVIYLYYALKKKDVFFNYSFIHESKPAYYGRVLMNIAKLAGVFFIGFFGAALFDISHFGSCDHLSLIIDGYISSVLSLGLEYLFISWTEKLSYDEKEHRGLHLGTFVKFIFLLINTVVAFGLALMVIMINGGFMNEFLTSRGYHLEEVLEELIHFRHHFAHESSVLTAMVLCKFMCQIRDCRIGRKAIGGIVMLTSFSFAISYITTFSMYFLGYASADTIAQFTMITSAISVADSWINAVLWTILIRDMTKTAHITSRLWIVVGVRWFLTVFGTVSTLTGHPGLTLFYGISGGILGIASLVLLLVLLHHHQYNHEHEEYV